MTDPGSYLGKSKEQFKISFGMSDKPISYVPAIKVEGILVDTSITLSSGALKLIQSYGIPVIWNGYKDDGMILLPFNYHGSVEVRKEQYAATTDNRAVHIGAKLVYATCYNKRQLLTALQGRHQSIMMKETIITIDDKLQEFVSDTTPYNELDLDTRMAFMNVEAICAKAYHKAIAELLASYNWQFNNRSRRPAQDPYNALLNYGYAVLKGVLSQYISISGLDLYAGFLHTDRSGRASLVLDMMEEFRQLCVDAVILRLIINNELHEDQFETTDEGIELSKEVKSIFLPAFFDNLQSKLGRVKIQRMLMKQPQELSNFLRGYTQDYQPYLLPKLVSI